MHIYQGPPQEKAVELLTNSNLPTADLGPDSMKHFFGCGTEDNPGGVAGLEVHENFGLLRSLAVAPEFKTRGCGKALVARVEAYAKDLGLSNLYLLTETAERYFSALGYVPIERKEVPEPIRRTSEFSAVCPETAVVMKKNLES
ncbi:GNAT family N-acetyltransferase [Synechocystis salina LEGE 06099]|uniref:arsenic resistance N-acetyltransferase ArsN2 n=1 Tax=Synechocystis salina TaxID=945780 RepID=UPI00187F5E02|nr:arsenic resistance N-acetyltransferase ArsN2 [Synechocystis salina]MBE9203202.1 GNAT family N-acetyltransferase [Synechocystis salina LEGE 06099]